MALTTPFAAPFAIRHNVSYLWKASEDIEKQQRMANDPANRGSLFNVRHAVLHSLRRFLIIFSNVLYSRLAIQCSPRRSPFASSFAAPFAIRLVIRCAIRLAVSYSFSLFKFRYSMFAAPLAIRSSPFANRHSLSLFNVP